MWGIVGSSYFEKNVWQFLQKLNMKVLYNSLMLSLVIYSRKKVKICKKMKKHIGKNAKFHKLRFK
jgi:hypothetical protein